MFTGRGDELSHGFIDSADSISIDLKKNLELLVSVTAVNKQILSFASVQFPLLFLFNNKQRNFNAKPGHWVVGLFLLALVAA